MAADGPRLLAGRRELVLLADHELEGPLEDVEGEVDVEVPLPAPAVDRAELFGRLAAAADRHAPAADAPEQELDRALQIAEVGLRPVLAAQEGPEHRHPAVLALQRDAEGAVGLLQIGLGPGAEGQEARVQRRRVPDFKRNAQIVHIRLLAVFHFFSRTKRGPSSPSVPVGTKPQAASSR